MSLSECIKEPLRPVVHKIKNVLKFKNRAGLTNRTFSVISNNCGGGFITQHFGVVYHSPTAGLFFHTEDYLRFVQNIQHYFEECRLEFIPPEDSVHYEYLKNTCMYGDYPVAKLDDIEIYFMHYKTEEDAASKWYRRAARADYNNMLVLLFENETTTPELLSEFDGLAMPHYELVYNHYKGLKYALYNQNVANHEQHAWKPEWVIETYDWKKELNKLVKYHGE